MLLTYCSDDCDRIKKSPSKSPRNCFFRLFSVPTFFFKGYNEAFFETSQFAGHFFLPLLFFQYFHWPKRNGILLSKLFWPTVRKNVLVLEKKLLKFEDEGREFSKFSRSLEKFIQTVKGQNNIGNRMLFKLFPGGFSDLID